MGFLNTRHLATSRPRSLTEGFPLFPPDTSIDAPALTQVIGEFTPDTLRLNLLDVLLPLAYWRFSARMDVALVSGAFFGFNLEYDVSAQTRDDGTGFLNVFNDSASGGIGVELSLELDGHLELDRAQGILTPTVGPDGLSFSLVGTWEKVFNESFNFQIDLLKVLYTALKLPLPRIVRGPQTEGKVGTIFGLFDDVRNQFGTRGSMELRPSLNVSVNILEKIPKLGSVIKVLSKVGMRISMGPTLNLIFPITFQIVRLVTEDGSYDVVSTGGVPGRPDQQILGGGPRRKLPPRISQATVVQSHTASFEFKLELHIAITLLGLFGIDEALPIPIDFGRLGSLGPYFTALSGGPETQVGELELPEVVWG